MTKSCVFVLLAAVLFGAGCASRLGESANKAGIRSVQFEHRIDARQGMRFGVNMSGGGLANALAGLIVDSAGQKGLTRMSSLMESNHIVVGDMVREKMRERLRSHSGLTLSETSADGTVLVSIVQYGFDTVNLSSSKAPFVLLRAELRDAKGKRIWKAENPPLSLSTKGVGATWDEYAADAARLRADWETQVSRMVEALVQADKQPGASGPR